MARTRVVNKYREACDISIMRPGMWGNPFVIGKHGTRAEVIELYREYLLANKFLMSRIGDLKGKVLGCCCKPQACHGDVLVEICERS